MHFTDEHYTYIHNPDGNTIELVYHPLELVDADGNPVIGSASKAYATVARRRIHHG
jgi:hypothetical protein